MRPSRSHFSKDDREREFLRHLAFGNGFELEAGRVYLAKEAKPERGAEAFAHLLHRGFHGLHVTRQHPHNLRKRNNMGRCRVVWLSSTLGEDYVDPHNLGSLISLIGVFLQGNRRPAVLLDGLEFLTINNDFHRILNFVEYLNEIVMGTGSILLLSVDERAFQKREMALLEKNVTFL